MSVRAADHASAARSSSGRGVPLTEAVLVAVANLVDDGGQGRQPSHSHLQDVIDRAGLASVDPARRGETVGKAKRMRAVLSYALNAEPAKGGRLVASVIDVVRGHGGFRPESPNYAGGEIIAALAAALRVEGVVLSLDGVCASRTLDGLDGRELTDALRGYIRRAKQGDEDAALLVGTSKDLVEATAKHVIAERMNAQPRQMDFPELLAQAFHVLNLATPRDPKLPGEHPRRRVERALYETACAVNALRNREGTGHGRPWAPTVTGAEARAAIEMMGIVAERMLDALNPTK